MTDIARSFLAVRSAMAHGDPAALRIARRDLAAALLASGGEAPLSDATTKFDEALSKAPDGSGEPDIRSALQGVDRQVLEHIANDGPLPYETWGQEAPPPREWLIRGFLPRGRLTSLYGEGGLGKSFLALQLAHAVMHGGAPLPSDPGLKPDAQAALQADFPVLQPLAARGKVLLLTWEDETAEIRHRWHLAHRAGALGREFPDPDMLHVVNMRQIRGPLWGPGEGGHVSVQAGWTDAGRRFVDSMVGHALTIIDPLAAAFGSNENDRALVRQFASALDGAAEETGCTALLVGHPPKSGDAAYSGSTDWRNAARASFHLLLSDLTGCQIPAANDDAKASRAPAFAFVDDKSSYAAPGHTMWLRMYREMDPDNPREALALAWQATTALRAAQARDSTAQAREDQTQARDVIRQGGGVTW